SARSGTEAASSGSSKTATDAKAAAGGSATSDARGGAAGTPATAVLDDAGASGTSGAGGSGAGDAEKPLDIRRWARAGTALTVLAAALHLGAIVTRTLAVMRVPWSNMMEYALIASAFVVVGYLALLPCRA